MLPHSFERAFAAKPATAQLLYARDVYNRMHSSLIPKGMFTMADITEVDFIWKNGELVPWAEAQTHVLSHSLHYGSGVFEGIRCYKDPDSGQELRLPPGRPHGAPAPLVQDEPPSTCLTASRSSARPRSTSSARTSFLPATSVRWSTAATESWESTPRVLPSTSS